jgi:hypothetical protein
MLKSRSRQLVSSQRSNLTEWKEKCPGRGKVFTSIEATLGIPGKCQYLRYRGCPFICRRNASDPTRTRSPAPPTRLTSRHLHLQPFPSHLNCLPSAESRSPSISTISLSYHYGCVRWHLLIYHWARYAAFVFAFQFLFMTPPTCSAIFTRQHQTHIENTTYRIQAQHKWHHNWQSQSQNRASKSLSFCPSSTL